jgi:hypothetical protein
MYVLTFESYIKHDVKFDNAERTASKWDITFLVNSQLQSTRQHLITTMQQVNRGSYHRDLPSISPSLLFNFNVGEPEIRLTIIGKHVFGQCMKTTSTITRRNLTQEALSCLLRQSRVMHATWLHRRSFSKKGRLFCSKDRMMFMLLITWLLVVPAKEAPSFALSGVGG